MEHHHTAHVELEHKRAYADLVQFRIGKAHHSTAYLEYLSILLVDFADEIRDILKRRQRDRENEV